MGDLAKPIHLPALGGGRETGEPTGNPQTQGEHVKLNTDSNPSTGLNRGPWCYETVHFPKNIVKVTSS